MSQKSPPLTLKSILFKKYLILEKIDQGSFGSIYLSKNIITNEKVAIKIENRKISNPLLEREAFILFYLKGPGLPEIKTFGKTKNLYILIQTLLGPSLSSLLDKYLITFTIKDICLLSIQMIERLEFIHSKSYIHRDIKPQNFLMGIKDPQMVYLIDFGLAKKFRSKKGKHIKFGISNSITGTPRYCSINALRGAQQSRRDDLESLFYVITYFFRGNLPWQNLKIKSRQERFNKINEIKKNVSYKILCKNLPKELYDFGIYIKRLNFEEDPNYFYMKKCFYSILEKMNEQPDNNFSWVEQFGCGSELKKNLNSSSYNNIFRQRNSSHKRLYEKISTSLEKKITKRAESNLINHQNTQIQNITKDNITLKSFNIENNIGNINRSNSYAGNALIKIPNLKKNNSSLIYKIISKNIYTKNNKSEINDNMNNIRRNETQILSNDNNFKSHLFLGDDSNNFSDMVLYNSNNNESLKNIFLRNNKIIYTSPNVVVDLKKKEKYAKNLKKVVANSENRYKVTNRNTRLKEQKIIFILNKTAGNSYKENNKIMKLSNFNNNKKLININKNTNNYKTFKRNIEIKRKGGYMNGINLTNNNSKSYSNIKTLEKKIKNTLINRTNTGTFLKPDKKLIYNTSYNKLNIKYNPINLKNIDYFKNRNINLNIKLINNNNYNNILLKNTKDKITNKGNNKKIYLDINKSNNLINKRNNTNRIIKYKTYRKNAINPVLFNSNIINYNIEENLNKRIRVFNIPIQKSKLDKKSRYNTNFFENNN